MDGVNSGNVSHPSSHGPSSKIGNILCSHLFGFVPHLLMCYANEIYKCVMYQNMWNVLCTGSKSRSINVLCTRLRSKNVLCNKINIFGLVNTHNYFTQIIHVIKWSSSLSLCNQHSITRCRYPLVLCLNSHDL